MNPEDDLNQVCVSLTSHCADLTEGYVIFPSDTIHTIRYTLH